MTLGKTATIIAVFLSIAGMAVAQDICSESDVVFCGGFEGTAMDVNINWQSPYPGYMTVEDSGPFNTPGNKALRVPFDKTHNVFGVLPEALDKVYVRWYQKWEAGYDFSVSHHHGLAFCAGGSCLSAGVRPNGCDYMWGWLDTKSAKTFWYLYYTGMSGIWGNEFPSKSSGAPVKADTWHCFEAMVDMGTPNKADGAVDLWVDGVQYGPFNNLLMRSCASLKVDQIILAVYIPGDAQPNKGLFFDDVVVSTQPIGSDGRVLGTQGSVITWQGNRPLRRQHQPFGPVQFRDVLGRHVTTNLQARTGFLGKSREATGKYAKQILFTVLPE